MTKNDENSKMHRKHYKHVLRVFQQISDKKVHTETTIGARDRYHDHKNISQKYSIPHCGGSIGRLYITNEDCRM